MWLWRHSHKWEGKLIIAFFVQFMGAETKALLYGVHWCKLNGVSRPQLETDSLMLLSCIKDVYKISWRLAPLIIQGIDWYINHCYREANQVAYKLANLSLQSTWVYLSSDNIPQLVRGFLNMDKQKISSFPSEGKKEP
uniref:RNase H type-1 domain-containing protein n=1 Tax=Solanum tuberosum TaxID=4113 RepID=M1CN82_SOLTU